MQQSQLSGMKGFTVVWIGQLISLMGSAMTTFALTIWIYEKTGSATSLALMILFGFGPTVLVSPIAGALVDRWNRKLVMMLSDLAAGMTTIIIFALVLGDSLEIWHLYALGALSSVFQAFQFPAYSAAITMMLDKKQYARAHGMQSMAQSASTIGAPIAAAALIGLIGIEGIMVIDIVTFSAAIITLLVIHVPQPEQTEEGREGQGNLWQEAAYGFHYIKDRPSLFGLQLVFFFANLSGAFALVMVAPMVLARTGNDEIMLGTVQSMFGVGGLVGGLLVSLWGGPKRRVHGVLVGMILTSLLGEGLLGVGRGVVVWSMGTFFVSFFIAILNSSNQAIWQAKVAPDVQGRVFAVRRLIAQITYPLGVGLAGPIADYLLEPAMTPGGGLAPAFGGLVGTGPGAGMALLILFAAIAGMTTATLSYAFPMIRNAEDILPDFEPAVAEPPQDEIAKASTAMAEVEAAGAS